MKNSFKKYWRKLDDQAKIFSLSYNNRDTSIFRLSVLLKENIDASLLEKAVQLALDKYKVFKMKIQRGFFWYYLEKNYKKPVVLIEDDYPFKKLTTKQNNDYMFKVSYFNNKINVDYFHALTDGNSGAEFLKEIVYRYLDLKYSNEFEDKNIEEILVESENAYKKNYKRKVKKSYKYPKAYTIKGEPLKNDVVSINHFMVDIKSLKKYSSKYECSLSVFLVAMIVYSLYEANYIKYNGKKPINVCVPINLKKYFPSETKSNFVSYMIITLNIKDGKKYTFDDILMKVKKEFEIKLKFEKVVSTMNSDGKKINNFFVRIVPLALKKAAVILGSFAFKKHFTMTFSNIGMFDVEDKYSKYIEEFFFILAPDWAEKMRCGICSYKDNMVVTFGTNIKGCSIEKKFKEMLKDNKIKYKIEGNGINVIPD